MIRRRKKEGRLFFVSLLTLSAVVITAIYWSVETFGDTNQHSFYEKFVANEAFLTQLPPSYTQKQTEAVQAEVTDFYKAAWTDEVNKAVLYEVSHKIETIMEDHQIVDREVKTLLALIRNRREM